MLHYLYTYSETIVDGDGIRFPFIYRDVSIAVRDATIRNLGIHRQDIL